MNRIKKLKYKLLILTGIIAVISILYISFMYIDITGNRLPLTSDKIKYISIILCFSITLLIGRNYITKKDKRLIQLGLLFTLIADLCLLIYSYHILGIMVFCVVQTIYTIRYESGRVQIILKRYTLILIGVISIYLLVDFFLLEVDFLFAIALFYAVLLLTNVVKSIKIYQKGLFPTPNKHMIAIGMVLFLLCDINVALYNTIEHTYIPSILIWFFYLPSQVLLALSGLRVWAL